MVFGFFLFLFLKRERKCLYYFHYLIFKKEKRKKDSKVGRKSTRATTL